MTRETVLMETPASRATRFIVAGAPGEMPGTPRSPDDNVFLTDGCFPEPGGRSCPEEPDVPIRVLLWNLSALSQSAECLRAPGVGRGDCPGAPRSGATPPGLDQRQHPGWRRCQQRPHCAVRPPHPVAVRAGPGGVRHSLEKWGRGRRAPLTVS